MKRIRHVGEIEKLASFHKIELSYVEGSAIELTTDIRTDSGYVVLLSESNDQLQRDFKVITDLQDTMFDVE